MKGTVRLLGLDYDSLSPEQALACLLARPAGAPFRYVVTPNADHIARLWREPALWRVYRQAWLCLLDSRVIAIAAGLIGLPVPCVCPGSDLTALLVARLSAADAVAVIGGSPRTLRRLGLTHAAQHVPPFGFEHDPAAFAAAVAFVLAHPARYVLLAVGSPRQEMLAQAIQATGRAVGTGLCIGASLAFVSGEARRAPPWMRRVGLEWLHRLCREPRRLARRYLLESPPVLLRLLRARWEMTVGTRRGI